MSLVWTDEKPKPSIWDQVERSRIHNAVIYGWCAGCDGEGSGVHVERDQYMRARSVQWTCAVCHGQPTVVFDPLIHSTRKERE